MSRANAYENRIQFEDRETLAQLSHKNVSEQLFSQGKYEPTKALHTLFNGDQNYMQKIIAGLYSHDTTAIRNTPVMRELLKFVRRALPRSQART